MMQKKKIPGDLLKPKNELSLFFAQRVDELTYAYTRESYRVSTTTVPFLIQECISVIQDHIEFDLHISGVERVLSELKRRCFGNPIVKDLIKIPLDLYFDFSDKDVSRLKDNLRVLGKQIGVFDYINKAIYLIENIDAKEKDKLDFLCGEYVCCLINTGRSREFIYKRCCEIFYSQEMPDGGDRLSIFLSDMKMDLKTIPLFDAALPVRGRLGKLDSSILKLFRTEFSESIPDFFLPEKNFREKYQEFNYLIVKDIKSPDFFTASKFVKKNIVRLHDLRGLFHHKGSDEFGEEMLLLKQGDDLPAIQVKSSQNLMQIISDNWHSLAAKKLQRMIKSVRLPGGEDREKFFRVVDFHGMSLASPVPENQLINLWTSLETIAPSVKGKSIIGGVVERVIPLIGLQYIDRIFFTIGQDLNRWNKREFLKAIKAIDLGTGTVEKTFLLIADPSYEAVIRDLLAKMDDFPLLKKRIRDLNGQFGTAKKSYDSINRHLEKVEQQLYRIYRARNSIVHSAKSNDLTENLVINAHEYFDQVFFLSVEMCSRPNKFNSYIECFNFAKISFESYMRQLKSYGNDIASGANMFVWQLR